MRCRSRRSRRTSGARPAAQAERSHPRGQAADPGRRTARRRGAHLRRQERDPADPGRRAAGRRPGHHRQRPAPAGRDHDDRAARPHGRERHGRRAHAHRGGPAHHPGDVRAVRAGEDHARGDPGARPAGGALRLGRRVFAGRLRDRRTAREHPRRGAAGDGRRGAHRERLHQGARGAAQGCAHRARDRHRHGDREPDDGGGAGRGPHHPGERGARAGDRRPGAVPERHGRDR